MASWWVVVVGAIGALVRRGDAGGGTKIPLTAANIIDGWCTPMGGGFETDVPYNLLDEQDKVGDPRATPKAHQKAPQTQWMPGYVTWYYPEVFAVVDLGRVYTVNELWGWHEFGGGHFQLEAGTDLLRPTVSMELSTVASPTVPNPIKYWEKSWVSLANFSGNDVTARYLTIRLYAPTNIWELVVYGTAVGPAPPSPPRPAPGPPRKAPLMRSFLGVNGFVDDPVSRLNAAGAVREYQDWIWTEGQGDPGFPHALSDFAPSYSSFNIDQFYRAVQNASLDLHQTMQGRPYFLSKGNTTRAQWKPVPDDQIYNLSAIVDPFTYAGVGGHAFQVAARYGSVAVPHSDLQLGPTQPVLSGTDLLKHIEILNEPDGWWAGREHFMKPFEIAAMLSAAYDGHEGRMSPLGKVGIKTADPKMQVVMPGVTGTAQRNLDIVRMVRLWAQFARTDKRFPADVLNFHGYSTDLKADPVDKTPEQNHMLEGLAELTQWRDTYEPALEVWLTEFGWDTDQRSTCRAVQYGSFSAEEVQAMWLVRGFILGAAAGLDRAHMFMLRNVNDNGATKFETCGLTSQKETQWQPKVSFYFVSTLTNVLGHMRLTAFSVDNSTHLYVAKFAADPADGPVRAGGATAAYVVWLGTMVEKTLSYKLQVPATASPMTLVVLAANSTVGNQSTLKPAGGGVTLKVSEVPQIVLVDAEPEPPTGPVPPIDKPVSYRCKTPSGDTLGPGIFCGDGNSTLPSPAFRVCPSGAMETCPNGQTCTAAGYGEIKCVPTSTSPCYQKAAGLYCDAGSKPTPAWPDAYVSCPSVSTFFCSSTSPQCTQNGTRVSCT